MVDWNPLDGIEHIGADLADGAKNIAKGAGDLIGGTAKAAGDIIEAPFKSANDALHGNFGQAVGDMVDAPVKAVTDLGTGVVNDVKDTAVGVFDFVKAPFDGAAAEIKQIVSPGDSSQVAKNANNAAAQANQTLDNGAGGGFGGLVGGIKGAASRVADAAVLQETGDFGTSDDILKAGQPGIDFFHAFFPLYQQAAPYVSGARNANLNLSTDIDGRYNESKGINMAAFRGDASHLSDILKQVQGSDNNLNGAFSGLSGWTGASADAARRYNGDLLGKIGGFLGGGVSGGSGGGANLAPGAITAAMTNIQNALKAHAGNVLKLYSGQCGGQSPQDVADNIRRASGNLDMSDIGGGGLLSGMWSMAKDAFVGGLLGGPVGGIVGAVVGAFSSGQDTRNNIINQAKQKLQAFVSEFDTKKASFDGYITSVEQQIQQDYQTMLTALKPLATDPLQGVSDPGTFSGSSGGGGGGNRGSGSGGGGGGMPSGGGGMPSGGGGGGSTTPASFTPPPTSAPTTGGTGLPSGGQESLTVQHGNQTLSMTSPDAHGAMQLSVQDGSGTAKKYEIDFPPNGATATPGVGGVHPGGTTPAGAAGVAGTPGAPGTPTMPGTPAAAGIPGAPGVPAAPGTGTAAPGADGVQHITPGPDGKAVIHDGNTTITATEGKNGEVKVVVDDGKSGPTTYTLDPKQPAPGGLPGTPGLAGTPGPAGASIGTGTPIPSAGSGAAAQAGFTAPPADPSSVVGAASGGVGSPGFTAPAAAAGGNVPAGGYAVPAPAGFTAPSAGAAAFTPPSAGQVTTAASADAFAGGLGGGGSTLGGGVGGGGGAAGFAQAFGGGAVPAPGAGTHDGGLATPTGHPGADPAGHAGVAGTNVTPLGPPGGAGLASAPGGPSGVPQGGMPMMGGGMGGGGGGGQGGDQQRGPSQWRTMGQLFEDDPVGGVVGRVSGTLDEQG